MLVTMMHVWVARVTVSHLRVHLRVTMRGSRRHWLAMLVPMMFVVDVRVFVRNLRMLMLVFMRSVKCSQTPDVISAAAARKFTVT